MSSQKRGHKKGFVLFVLVILVLGGIGFAAWKLLDIGKNPSGGVQSIQSNQKPTIPCDSTDKTLCKFISNWQPTDAYKYTIHEESGGTVTDTIYEYDLGDTDKIRTLVTGSKEYEVITIGSTIYTKAGDIWWKRTVKEKTPSKSNKSKNDQSAQKFQSVKPTQYTSSGKEKCGKMQCYKYKVNDPGNLETTQYVWFDNKEYKLRKLSFDGPDGTSEQTIEYEKPKITAPPGAKTLPAGQKIVPGEDVPSPL